jgi:hypothetical protein
VDAMLAWQVGWELPGGVTVAVQDLSVTFLQLHTVAKRRRGLNTASVCDALGLGPQADVAARLPALRRVHATAWQSRRGPSSRSLCGAWRLMASKHHGGKHHPPYYSFSCGYAVLLPTQDCRWVS